jgi:hypothetical protein
METTTRETDAPDQESEDADDAAPMSRGKRLGISALIVLTLLGMLASTAPRSVIKDGLLDLTRPYLLATGLDQAWGVFAPSPPRTTNDVVAHVERADGTVGVYPLEGSAGIPEYGDYRWRKYGEQLWKKRPAVRERPRRVLRRQLDRALLLQRPPRRRGVRDAGALGAGRRRGHGELSRP